MLIGRNTYATIEPYLMGGGDDTTHPDIWGHLTQQSIHG